MNEIFLDSNEIEFFMSSDYLEDYKKYNIEINNQCRFIVLKNYIEQENNLIKLIMKNRDKQFYTIDYVDNVRWNLTFKGAISYYGNNKDFTEIVFEL